MRIGIISELTIKPRNPFERYQREFIYSEKNPFELIIVRLPYSAERLAKISPKRIKQSVFKAEEILKTLGADKIIYSELLKEYSDIVNNNRNQAFSSIIPHCIRSIAPKCGIYPPDCRICIRTNKMDRITEYLAREMCYDTKKLILCFPENCNVTDFQEQFYNETGFFAEITYSSTADAEILVDLINPSVRIGRDILIDGAELDLELGGCNVDFLEVAACINSLDISKKISSYIMGKKKLTLSAT